MSMIACDTATDSVIALLDQVAAAEPVQSNCMFQLALMVARIAVEPCAESYKEDVAQAMMELIRVKPKSNVVSLFGDRPRVGPFVSDLRDAG